MKSIFRNILLYTCLCACVACVSRETPEPKPEPTPEPVSPKEVPVLWIETQDSAEIVSKQDYLKAQVRIDTLSASANIKGHGNSTWGAPKKPYRMKFDEKTALLGMPEGKTWVLLANYFDKTMLRNAVAFYISSLSDLEYTPKSEFVDLTLNGRYEGTYQLTERLTLGKNRLNLKDGFLLEADARVRETDSVVRVRHIEPPIRVKEPDELTAKDMEYVRTFLMRWDQVLYSDYFVSLDSGWTKYMDMQSAVEWYLVQEITENPDGVFWVGCYMNLERGGKLKIGPVWDFDIAFGNHDRFWDPEAFYIKDHAKMYQRLFRDPAFVIQVKWRYRYFYEHKEEILRYIDSTAEYLRPSVLENEKRWGTLAGDGSNQDAWDSYQTEVQNLKQWLNTRMDWLKARFDNM